MHATLKNIRVTRAHESEAPACLALLPELGGAPAELLIARMDGEFAGAAGVVWTNWGEPAGFNVAVKVLQRVRGQGVGRKLITAAMDLIDGETDGLWSLQATPLDSPAAQFLEACGFAPRKWDHYFQIGVSRMLDHIGRIARRYRERGHIPPGADVVFLSDVDAPVEEIAWLIARELNNHPLVHVQTLRRRFEDSADRSMIARFNGELVGVMLWRVESGVAIADVRVVARQWRSGWPNLLMMETGLLRAQKEGLDQIKFFSDESLNDTRNLAKRGEGKETDVKARYYLPFD
jgi:GNAT superfamily N-acetyltransferase